MEMQINNLQATIISMEVPNLQQTKQERFDFFMKCISLACNNTDKISKCSIYLSPPKISSTPKAKVSSRSVLQSLLPLHKGQLSGSISLNCRFQEKPQGNYCMNSFYLIVIVSVYCTLWPLLSGVLFLVNLTKNWSGDQFLVKIGHVSNSNCHSDQILVIFTKYWSPDQFLVKFNKNKKPERKGLYDCNRHHQKTERNVLGGK